MAGIDPCVVLEDVPKFKNLEHPDIFSDALSIALCYRDEALQRRFPEGAYEAISGFSGRGWLIGFDDAGYDWDEHGVRDSQPGFAASSPASYFEHVATLRDAIRFLDRAPDFLWNQDCAYEVDGQQAAGFIAAAESVDEESLRRYITGYLTTQRRPVIALLHLPGVPIVEMALLTGYESDGEVILGRSPYQNPRTDNSGPFGYFRLAGWEREMLAVLGVGEERMAGWDKHPCYVAIENALRCSRSYTCGTRHYGLAAYDAWERSLLDDAGIVGADDAAVSRRLCQHSGTAGFIACQKAFTVLPDCDAPSMGVVTGLVRRASAGPGLIHGLMWDAWQAVGGYWRGVKSANGESGPCWENPEEIRRFRDRAVRERAAQVVRRARQVDAQAIQDLQEAKAEWDRCLGHGNGHRCPCWDTPCARV